MHIDSIEERKRMYAWLQHPSCTLFGQPVVYVVQPADVDRLVMEAGVMHDGVQLLQQIQQGEGGTDEQHVCVCVRRMMSSYVHPVQCFMPILCLAGTSFSHISDLIATVRDALTSQHTHGPPPDASHDDARRMILDYLSSPECTLFEHAREVKAVASEIDRLIETGGTAMVRGR